MGRTHRAPEVLQSRSPRDEGLPFELSRHAIERFQARMTGGMSYGRCAHELRILARTAKRTQGRTGIGDEIWEATDGEAIRFVVKDLHGRRVCVTVLGARQDDGPDDLEGVA